jgi:general secretion pathway protein A
MYNAFFGFKERPFQLVPNPAYLFLSKSHEEALAHLVYAISHGDGFVEIVGEVGTGKTTLCRVFLENLDDSTEAAYIFNPKLDAIQLLKAINDEFSVDSSPDTSKELIDRLNGFLLTQKAAGKNVILLIDEAQNLSHEVLEQLRLLSNMETNTGKLLQIILVGQPELSEMLSSYQLRQLGQRITLSCRLTPLTFKESREYIQHRLHVASPRPRVQFSPAAFRGIYRFSRGVPRLINIVCDRALLTAFGYNKLKITGSIVRGSIRELRGGEFGRPRHGWLRNRGLLLLAGIVLLLLPAVLFLPEDGLFTNPLQKILPSLQPRVVQTAPEGESSEKPTSENVLDRLVSISTSAGTSEPGAAPDMADQQVPSATEALRTSGVVADKMISLATLLPQLSAQSSRNKAAQAALSLWGADPDIALFEGVQDELTFFQLITKKNNLFVRRFEGNLSLLNRINLPAVLRFEPENGGKFKYLTLCGLTESEATLCGAGEYDAVAVEIAELEKFWSGISFVPWRNFMEISGTLPEETDYDSVVKLKSLLREIGFSDIDTTPYYDEQTRLAIIDVQKKYGINVDGVVGSSTKIVLYNEEKTFPAPHIVSE